METLIAVIVLTIVTISVSVLGNRIGERIAHRQAERGSREYIVTSRNRRKLVVEVKDHPTKEDTDELVRRLNDFAQQT